MRIPRGWTFAVVVTGVAACAGVSPRPDAVSPDSLPNLQLSVAETARRDVLVERCVAAVVVRRFDDAERDAHTARR